MTRQKGKDLDFTVGGTQVPKLTSADWSASMGTHVVTAGGEDNEENLSGEKSDQITVSFWDQEDQVGWDLFVRQDAVLACVNYPLGNTSTNPSETFNARVISKDRPVGHNAPIACTVVLKVTGGVTEGTVS